MAVVDCKDFNGLKLPAEFHLVKEKIEHFDVRNDDVWVTSYPKSGTTWCQEMVWLIGNNLDYEGGKVDLDDRYPFIEFNGFVDESNRFIKKHNISVKNYGDVPDFLKVAENSKGVRYIKTHLPWDFLPRQIIDGDKTPKVSNFLGKFYSEEEMKKLAHHLSFAEMKTNVAVNAQRFLQNEELQFIRKGAPDSYKQELTPEMINKLDQWVTENIKDTELHYENS